MEVRYGTGRELAPARTILRRGASIVVTVPTVDAGQPIEIVGRAEIPGQAGSPPTVLESALEMRTLQHGADTRVESTRLSHQSVSCSGVSFRGGACQDSCRMASCDACGCSDDHVTIRIQVYCGNRRPVARAPTPPMRCALKRGVVDALPRL